MQIQVSLTKDDYADFNRFVCLHLKSKQRSQWLKDFTLWLVFGVIFVFLFQTVGKGVVTNPHWPTAIMVGTFAVFLFIAFTYESKKTMALLTPEDDGLVLGEKTMSFDENGITVNCEHCHSLYRWPSVKEIAEHKGTYYIFLDTVLAHIIPSSAFVDERQKQDIVKFVEQQINANVQ